MVVNCVLKFLPLILLLNVTSVIEGIENSKLYIELVESRGYPIETHEVETEDGYLLTVYRISHGRSSNSTGTPNRYPVLLHHGLIESGEYFFFLNKSIGYLLADNGYDVWAMNARGSWHSIKHRTLDPKKDDEYWRFTWHEIGVYDIPATIDFILNNTGAQNLSYIGHSQGTTSMFVMGAVRPQYNEKINGMVAMAPATVPLNSSYIFIRLFGPHYKLVKAIARFLNIQRFPPILSNSQLHAINHFICGQRFSPRRLCKFIITFFLGPDDDQLDTSILPVLTQIFPASCSFHQMIHYLQNYDDGKFSTFDWGSKENLRRYGSEKTVEYNVTNINFEVALYSAPNDVFLSDQSMQLLESTLPNISEVYRIPYETWTHFDFLWATDLDIYLHHNLLKTLNGFTQNGDT